MAYDAKVVANYFLNLAKRDSVQIFPLKMQKLVYLAHGWSLALRGEPLIKDKIEAWKYGPVVPKLYHEFKKYGASAIKEPASAPTNEIDPDSKKLIEAVWNRYKALTGIQLSALTHEPGYAWDSAIKTANPFFTPVITNTLIADEFERRHQQK